jgi:hypothetical protein
LDIDLTIRRLKSIFMSSGFSLNDSRNCFISCDENWKTLMKKWIFLALCWLKNRISFIGCLFED